VAPGLAALLGLPYLSYAAKIEPSPDAGTVRVHRIAPKGFDVIEAPMPALVVCTQALGEPRYPSLKGIMAARQRELTTRSLADVGLSPGDVGGSVATTAVLGSEAPPERPPTRVVRGSADEAARELVDFLAQRRIV
jgi:electron transfer flavoprotein beta subunit